MSRTGPTLRRSDRSRTGFSITHSVSGAGGVLTAFASSPSFCRLARHSSSTGEAAESVFAGAGWAGPGGGALDPPAVLADELDAEVAVDDAVHEIAPELCPRVQRA